MTFPRSNQTAEDHTLQRYLPVKVLSGIYPPGRASGIGQGMGGSLPGGFGRRNPFPVLPEFAPAPPERSWGYMAHLLGYGIGVRRQSRNCELYGFRFSVHILW